MSFSPLLTSVSPLALAPLSSPQRTASLGSPEQKGNDASSARRKKVGTRVYSICIAFTVVYLALRVWRSHGSVQKLSRELSTKPGHHNGSLQIIPVSEGDSEEQKQDQDADEDDDEEEKPNCRRQYWYKSTRGHWRTEFEESWFSPDDAPCSDIEAATTPSSSAMHCPDTSSILLVLLSDPTAPSANLRGYFEQTPCVNPSTSLAIYSAAPGSIEFPYPHTDCLNCNARVVVSIHDTIAIAALNTTLPPDVLRLHDTLVQHHYLGLDTSAFVQHKHYNELQRYRLLVTLLHAYEHWPKKKWFVVATEKGYVSVRNVVAWARQTKQRGPVYAGSEMAFDGREFAALDAGMVVNRGAIGRLARYGGWEILPDLPSSDMRGVESKSGSQVRDSGDAVKLAERGIPWLSKQKTYLSKWYTDLSSATHADVALASSFYDIGVNLTRFHPLMRATDLLSTHWTRDNWCSAALTFGKVSPSQRTILHHAEQRMIEARAEALSKKPKRFNTNSSSRSVPVDAPIRHADVFRYALLPRLKSSPSLLSWDNEAGDLEYYDGKKDFHHAAKPFISAEACQGICGLAMDCLQWRWEPGRCKLGKTVRMGKAVVDADDKVKHEWNGVKQGVVSGWMGLRIEEMVEKWDRDCRNSTGFER